MKKVTTIGSLPALTVGVVLMVFATAGRSDEPKAEKKNDNKLLGTWRLVSAKYGGRISTLPQQGTTVKHVTATQFMWATYDNDGKLTRAAGGTYTLKGDTYAESPVYGFSSDFSAVGGKTHTFKWKVEGNKWHHSGALSNGLTIEEVWERDEAK